MIKNNYHIRPMQAADLSAVLLIEQEQAFPWTEGMLRDCLQANYECWVLTLEQTIIGFGIFTMQAEHIELLNIAIKKRYQGQGYGKKILGFLIELAKNKPATEMFLEVRASNVPALTLYKKLNFQQIAVRKDYYPVINGREDALVLLLRW